MTNFQENKKQNKTKQKQKNKNKKKKKQKKNKNKKKKKTPFVATMAVSLVSYNNSYLTRLLFVTYLTKADC